jgi:SNF2 family DNA or RNA helicase
MINVEKVHTKLVQQQCNNSVAPVYQHNNFVTLHYTHLHWNTLTYTISYQQAFFKKFEYEYVVIDEAHRIKNENSTL